MDTKAILSIVDHTLLLQGSTWEINVKYVL